MDNYSKMVKGKALKCFCVTKRFKQTFIALVFLVLLTVLLMDRTKEANLISRYFTHLRNASSNLVQQPVKNYFDKNKNGVFDMELNENCTEEFKSSHFMTVYIMGRTGNELFELCTLIATAHDACYTAFIPTDTELVLADTFRIQNVIRKDVFKRITDYEDFEELGWGIHTKQIYKMLDLRKNYKLFGSFQSFKHFQHKKELLCSSFVFKDEIKSDVINYFTNMSLNARTKVGIHIRRGDFLEDWNIKKGYLPPSKEFIQKAFTYFNEIFKNTELVFIIVSDDITWCKENIRYRNVYYSPFNDSGRDLNILTQSDHNVVSSGTFGWMGAWLNETGIVVYDKSFPKYKSLLWRGYRRQDYYPPWWIGL